MRKQYIACVIVNVLLTLFTIIYNLSVCLCYIALSGESGVEPSAPPQEHAEHSRTGSPHVHSKDSTNHNTPASDQPPKELTSKCQLIGHGTNIPIMQCFGIPRKVRPSY